MVKHTYFVLIHSNHRPPPHPHHVIFTHLKNNATERVMPGDFLAFQHHLQSAKLPSLSTSVGLSFPCGSLPVSRGRWEGWEPGLPHSSNSSNSSTRKVYHDQRPEGSQCWIALMGGYQCWLPELNWKRVEYYHLLLQDNLHWKGSWAKEEQTERRGCEPRWKTVCSPCLRGRVGGRVQHLTVFSPRDGFCEALSDGTQSSMLGFLKS